ncbi:MAG: hypothetical protein WCB49_04020 [Gammaproteobacteria bacterium]
MTIAYKLSLDASYYRTLREHYCRQRPFRFSPAFQYSLPLIPLAGLWVYAETANADWASPVGWGALWWAMFFLIGIAFSKWAVTRQFKRKTDFGSEGMVSLSDNGISVSSPYAKGELNWEIYPRAVRFPDGILLMRKGAIRWLPDSAIQAGTPEDATALVRSKSVLRSI